MQLLPGFWWLTWSNVSEVVDITSRAQEAGFSTGVLSADGFVSGGAGP